MQPYQKESNTAFIQIKLVLSSQPPGALPETEAFHPPIDRNSSADKATSSTSPFRFMSTYS
jgi:hypothetical protein